MSGVKLTNRRQATPTPDYESADAEVDGENLDWEPDTTEGLPPGDDPGDVLTWDGDSWEPAPAEAGDPEINFQPIAGAAQDLDWAAYRHHDFTVTEALTLTESNPPEDQRWGVLTLVLRGGPGAPYAITYPAAWVFPDTTNPRLGGGPVPDPPGEGEQLVLEVTSEDGGVTVGVSYDLTGVTLDFGEVSDIQPVGATTAAGSTGEVADAGHVHTISKEAVVALGFHGDHLLASDHAVPFTFDDLIQDSDGTGFLFASEP